MSNENRTTRRKLWRESVDAEKNKNQKLNPGEVETSETESDEPIGAEEEDSIDSVEDAGDETNPAKEPGEAAAKGQPSGEEAGDREPMTKIGMINAMNNKFGKSGKKSLQAMHDQMMGESSEFNGLEEITEATKQKMINAMNKKMYGANKQTLNAMYDSVMGQTDDDSEEEEPEKNKDKVDESWYMDKYDTLLESEQTLSNKFKNQSKALFRQAVNERVAAEVGSELSGMEEEMLELYEDRIADFMNMAVDRWLSDNRVAVKNSTKAALAEQFLERVRDAFVDTRVVVPDNEINLFEELQGKIKTMSKYQNQITSTAMKAKREIEALRKDKVINEECGDLSQSKLDRVKTLLEKTDYSDDKDFRTKVQEIKETLDIGRSRRRPSRSKFNANHGRRTLRESMIDDDDYEVGEYTATGSGGMMDKYLEAHRKLG